MKKALITATVQSHVAQFHKPLMKLLKENGYEIHVAARDNLVEKNGLSLEFADQVFNIPFARSPFSKNNISAYKQLKAIINRCHYDLVSCNTPVGGVLTRMAAKKARKNGTTVYYTAHGFHFYKGAPLQNWLVYYPVEKLMAHKTDKLITISDEDYRLACNKIKTKIERIHGIGANTAKYFPACREKCMEIKNEIGAADATPVLICTGELLDNKNQAAAVRAVAALKKDYPQVLLMLAGNGPKLEELKALAQNLGVSQNVRFLGYCTDLEKYINASDIAVACSFREGLGMNVIESMLCAKPVVASNNRGHRELVQEGKTGFIVDARDPQAFAEKIRCICRDGQLYQSMSKQALTAAQPYREENVREELETIYGFSKK